MPDLEGKIHLIPSTDFLCDHEKGLDKAYRKLPLEDLGKTSIISETTERDQMISISWGTLSSE